MTQPKNLQAPADLIERTLESLRVAAEDIKVVSADLKELAEYPGAIATLVQTARGTALIRGLRLDLNELNKLLPFKG